MQSQGNRFKRMLLPTIVIAVIFILGGLMSVMAQQPPELVNLNENTLGEISATNITARYSFVAQAGQPVLIQVLGVSAGFAPSFRVVTNAGTVVDSAPNATNTTVAETTVTPPQTGVLTIEVQSANGAPGQFVLSLQPGTPPPPPIPLNPNAPVQGLVDSTARIQRYSFNASNTIPVQLTIISNTPGGGPSISLQDGTTGEVLGTLSLRLSGGSFRIPPGVGGFILQVTNSGAGIPEGFSVQLGPADGGVLPPDGGIIPTATQVTVQLPPTLVPTPGFAITPLPLTGPCVISPEGENAVNVRSGPSTSDSIITSVVPNSITPVIGRLPDSSWWQVNVSGTVGWMAGFVSRLGGDCGSVPVFAPPATPTPIPVTPEPDAPPDLVITSISGPSSIAVNTDFAYNVTVTNVGGQPAGAFRVRGTFPAGTPTNPQVNVAGLNPGASITVSVGTVSYAAIGDYTATFLVDSAGEVAESNEFNNESSANFTVTLIFVLPPGGILFPTPIIPIFPLPIVTVGP